MKHKIVLDIEVDEKDCNKCHKDCGLKYYEADFGDNIFSWCKGSNCMVANRNRSQDCIDADITDKLNKIEELEKSLFDANIEITNLKDNCNSYSTQLSDCGKKIEELEKRNRVLERAMEILRGDCYIHSTLGLETIERIEKHAIDKAQQEIESEEQHGKRD